MGESWKWQLRDSDGQWIKMGSRVSWLDHGLTRFGQVVGSPKAGVATVRPDGRPKTHSITTNRLRLADKPQVSTHDVPTAPSPTLPPSKGAGVVPADGRLISGPDTGEYFKRRFGGINTHTRKVAKAQVAEQIGSLMTDVTMDDLAAMKKEHVTGEVVSEAMNWRGSEPPWLCPDEKVEYRWEVRSKPRPGAVRWGTPEAEQAMRVSMASDITFGWAMTAAHPSPHKAAESEFGIMGASTLAAWPWAPPDLSPTGASQKVNRSYQRAARNLTQAQLRADGIKTVRLYRGTQRKTPLGKQTTSLRPLSSWTTDYRVAKDFAKGGAILTTEVPVDRIVSMPGTGMGCLEEFEMILSGGPLNVEVGPA